MSSYDLKMSINRFGAPKNPFLGPKMIKIRHFKPKIPIREHFKNIPNCEPFCESYAICSNLSLNLLQCSNSLGKCLTQFNFYNSFIFGQIYTLDAHKARARAKGPAGPVGASFGNQFLANFFGVTKRNIKRTERQILPICG